MMTPSTIENWSAEVSRHLYEAYLPFWCGPALDEKNGGWMSWLSNDLQPDRTQPKGLIVNARILWAFSAAYRGKPSPLLQEMATRAYEFVMRKFWDDDHGGAFWRLDDHGRVMDDSKKIYGQAFYIYALSEYYQATGAKAALERAKHLFELVEKHAHDGQFGGYVEVCRRDWSEAGPEARLSEKDMNEKKSMNNHLHVLEAYTNLRRIWPDDKVSARLRELTELFLAKILDAGSMHLHHFFDAQWTVRSDTYTFGHDIEASWLLCEAAEELGDSSLTKRVRSVAIQMAETTLNEGLSAEGGLSYEGRDGKIIDPRNECWPQAESIVGFINAHEISGDSKYLSAARRVWDFTQKYLVDPVHGEWFWRINPDGRPDQSLPKVSEWKGPYHVTRSCLETIRRIGIISHKKHNAIP